MSMIGKLHPIPKTTLGKLTEAAVHKLQAGKGLSLDKHWDSLRFVLDRLCRINPITGGTEIEHGDCGYGPATVMGPDDVRLCARHLAAIGTPALRHFFDPDALAAENVYPSIWDEDRADLFKSFNARFKALRAFYQAAAKQGHGVMFFVS